MNDSNSTCLRILVQNDSKLSQDAGSVGILKFRLSLDAGSEGMFHSQNGSMIVSNLTYHRMLALKVS
jgi:hypothetical protein